MHTYLHSLWLSIPLTLLVVSAAGAEPIGTLEEPTDERARPLFSKELTRSRELPAEEISESRDWRRIRLRKGAGLELRREVSLGDRNVVLGVKGPLMKKKRLGLAFEVRF